MQLFLATLGVYFGVDLLSAWSVNLQFAYGGIPNFAYIMFLSVGAYVAGVTSMGSAQPGQTYILGAHLPFPLPLVAAGLAGGALSFVIGLFVLRSKLRRDYQAALMFIVEVIAVAVVSTATGIFNGGQGIVGVPQPLYGTLNVSPDAYNWIYLGWVLFLCFLAYLFIERMCRSNWGRAVRSMRDHPEAAWSMGLNVAGLRMQVFVLGGIIAGLAGGLFVEFIQAWSPSAWGYQETFTFFAAIIVGGSENNRGALVGTALVPILFTEIPTFLPSIGYQGLKDSLEWIIIGIIWIAFIAFRPQGVLPGRRVSVLRSRKGAAGWEVIHGIRTRLRVKDRTVEVREPEAVLLAVGRSSSEHTGSTFGVTRGAGDEE